MVQAEFLFLLDRSREARLSGNPTEALRLACCANRLLPNEPAGHHTVALALSDLGSHDRAFFAWERAMRLLQDPVPDNLLDSYQKIVFAFAWALLRRGEWRRAWPYWEAGRILAAWSPFPGTEPWNGESDGNLLILPEGGYGDLFCFSRFLRTLHRSPIRPPQIGLCVPPAMQCARNWQDLGVDAVYEIGGAVPMGQYRYSISLLSLPGLLGIGSPVDMPMDCQWPDTLHIRRRRPWFAAAPRPRRIGFCWRAEEAGESGGRKVRSLPPPTAGEIVAKLSKLSSVFDLCPHAEGQPVSWGFIHEEDCMRTWTDTADYLTTMNLILTVDTAVAHLAGLLGLDTLCLLPVNSDWKWLLDREDTVWYPGNFKLFRNATTAWEAEPIVEAAIATLSSRCATRLPRPHCHSKS